MLWLQIEDKKTEADDATQQEVKLTGVADDKNAKKVISSSGDDKVDTDATGTYIGHRLNGYCFFYAG